MGLNAPLGLVINELRTDPNQSLVFDKTGAAFLENPVEPTALQEYILANHRAVFCVNMSLCNLIRR